MIQISLLEPTALLQWKQCSPLPHPRKHVQAVEFNGKVYIGSGYGSTNDISCQIYCYIPNTDTWEDCSNSQTRCFAMTIFDDTVLLIGGILNNNTFSKQVQFLSQGNNWKFYKSENMPDTISARAGAVAASLTFNLVVAGGYKENKNRVNTVEVYDRRSKMWFNAPELPHTCAEVKTAIAHGDQWYLLGGSNQYKRVFTASLQKLAEKSVKPLMADFIPSNGTDPEAIHDSVESEIWTSLAELPFDFSFVSIFGKSLVALGGEKTKFTGSVYTSQLYVYNSNKKEWIHIADMPVSLTKATALTQPNGDVLIIGGRNKARVELNTMYKYKLVCAKSCMETGL